MTNSALVLLAGAQWAHAFGACTRSKWVHHRALRVGREEMYLKGSEIGSADTPICRRSRPGTASEFRGHFPARVPGLKFSESKGFPAGLRVADSKNCGPNRPYYVPSMVRA